MLRVGTLASRRTVADVRDIAAAYARLMVRAEPAAAYNVGGEGTFSMGELLIVPTLDSLASDISPMVTVGSYLGFVSMGWALGGLVGNLAGGALYSIAKSAGNFPEFWGINVAVGVVTAATFLLLGRLVHPRVRAREAAASS